MRISDWSSDVCSSDLEDAVGRLERGEHRRVAGGLAIAEDEGLRRGDAADPSVQLVLRLGRARGAQHHEVAVPGARDHQAARVEGPLYATDQQQRTEESRVGEEWIGT